MQGIYFFSLIASSLKVSNVVLEKDGGGQLKRSC